MLLTFTNIIVYSLGLWQRKIVIWTQVGTILAYLSVLAAIWGHCTPVEKNWQIYPNPGGTFLII